MTINQISRMRLNNQMVAYSTGESKINIDLMMRQHYPVLANQPDAIKITKIKNDLHETRCRIMEMEKELTQKIRLLHAIEALQS